MSPTAHTQKITAQEIPRMIPQRMESPQGVCVWGGKQEADGRCFEHLHVRSQTYLVKVSMLKQDESTIKIPRSLVGTQTLRGPPTAPHCHRHRTLPTFLTAFPSIHCLSAVHSPQTSTSTPVPRALYCPLLLAHPSLLMLQLSENHSEPGVRRLRSHLSRHS